MLIAAALFALAVVAAFSAALRVTTVALDLVFVVLIALDWALTPAPESLDVRRRLQPRAGLGQEFVRTLRVDTSAHPRAAGRVLEVDEEFSTAFEVRARTRLLPGEVHWGATRPAALPAGTVAPARDDPSGGSDATLLPPSGPIDIVRVYRSSLRGVHGVGDLRLRLGGRLGLVQRSGRLAGEQTIAIEPALLGLSRNLRLAASERWLDLGVQRLRRRGGMTEFESLREHVVGDDVRLVDWKAFAKRGRPIVRQFQEERGQELLILVDCGRRMGATTPQALSSAASSSGAQSAPAAEQSVRRAVGARVAVARGMTKLDHALDAALQLAAIALEHGDRVGALAFDSTVRAWVPPARGRAHFRRLRDALFALEARSGESDLERALRELSLCNPRRALVLVLSDVADPLSVDRQRNALRAGTSRHRVVFAALDDPSLRAVADGRTAADAPTRAAALTLSAERAAGLRRISSAGVRCLDALPAEAAAPLIAAWLEARRSGS